MSADAVASYLPTVEGLVRSHLASWAESGTFDLETKARALPWGGPLEPRWHTCRALLPVSLCATGAPPRLLPPPLQPPPPRPRCQVSSRASRADAARCWQLRHLTMSFSSDIVVGLNLSAEDKQALALNFQGFTTNLYCLMIDLPGSTFRKAKEAKQRLLDIIQPNVEASIAALDAGEWAATKRKSTMQARACPACSPQSDRLWTSHFLCWCCPGHGLHVPVRASWSRVPASCVIPCPSGQLIAGCPPSARLLKLPCGRRTTCSSPSRRATP